MCFRDDDEGILIDLAQELEENENSFFRAENIRFFRLFSNRVSRLFDMVNSLLDYTNQIRDTYESRLDVKQNRIMTVLTVVTTIFMPLTLIAGIVAIVLRFMMRPWPFFPGSVFAMGTSSLAEISFVMGTSTWTILTSGTLRTPHQRQPIS